MELERAELIRAARTWKNLEEDFAAYIERCNHHMANLRETGLVGSRDEIMVAKGRIMRERAKAGRTRRAAAKRGLEATARELAREIKRFVDWVGAQQQIAAE